MRPRQPEDREACLAVFDSNAPEFFDPAERPAFADFLTSAAGPYFVMEHEGTAVGCGGFTVEGEASARLLWGMIRRDAQGQGLGRLLLLYRVREIGKLGAIATVHAEAPPRSAHFFVGQGFRVVDTIAGRVHLLKKLTVCA